jgi:hypothetical protein
MGWVGGQLILSLLACDILQDLPTERFAHEQIEPFNRFEQTVAS